MTHCQTGHQSLVMRKENEKGGTINHTEGSVMELMVKYTVYIEQQTLP